ncbi:site-specific recombinase, DNA invertase Pin related protein [Liquorilactobacillus nagelii DSM 13675]|nr:site-specific recombinase, DNA invertase Pin related protein [Liquorilactobacillus nagelii DSM 13675]
MLNYLRDDDEVIVVSLDRLGRNSKDPTDIIEASRQQGATNVLNLPSFADIEDPNLRNLITNIIVDLYKYIAQEERETIREHQRQGIEIAKKQGKYKGKVREYDPASPNRQKRYIYNEACKLLDQKKLISRRDSLPECWKLHRLLYIDRRRLDYEKEIN